MSVSESIGKKSSPNRRRIPRVGLITQVESVADGLIVLGKSQDISAGGLKMAAGQTFAAGTEVVVRFNLPPFPPGFPIQSRGIIAWVQAGESMGIRFMQPDDKRRRAIANYSALGGRMTELGPL